MSETPHGVQVPEFAQKIELLFRKGGYAYDDTRRRIPICDRPSLAEALRVDQAQLTRWIRGGRIPRTKNAIKLAEIFLIDWHWLTEPYDVFQKLCSGARHDSAWATLLARAKHDDVGTVVQLPDAESPPLQTLAARPDSTVEQLTVIQRGSLVKVRFKIPLSGSGAVAWSGWFITLLSEDPNGFLCLLPRFLGTDEFPRNTHSRFQPNAWFECSGLRMDATLTGEHAFVLIATQEPWPVALNDSLMAEREGEALLPSLDRLASYLAPLCSEASAAIHRPRFRVES